jgi:hypothetical protein
MKSIRKQTKPVAAEAIARLADKGKDVSRFFTNTGRMMGPTQSVNVISWRLCWKSSIARRGI